MRGRATIVRDADLRQSMALKGRVPELALVVDLTEAYFHCAKCIIRSKLWAGEAGTAPDDVLLATTMVQHGGLDLAVAEMQQIILADEDERLY